MHDVLGKHICIFNHLSMHVSRDQSQLLVSGDVHLEHRKHFIIRSGGLFSIWLSLLEFVQHGDIFNRIL